MYRYLVLAAMMLSSATSVRADCVPGTYSGPCLCLQYEDLRFAVQCSDVTDGAQITEALVEFAIAEIETLDIINSPELTSMPADAFGSTQINHISISSTGLQTLATNTFSGPTQSSLLSLYLKHSESFTTVDLDLITSLTSLQELYFSNNGFTGLTGSIGTSATLQTVDFSRNYITSIDGDFFTGTPAVSVVLLSFNQLTTASLSGTSLSFSADLTDLYLDLGFNQLTEGLAGVEFTAAVPRELILSGNGITELAEESFAPLMAEMAAQYPDSSPYILLDSNPLVCGCDLAWVPENPQKEMLQGAVCANGQLVGNLQPEDFADC